MVVVAKTTVGFSRMGWTYITDHRLQFMLVVKGSLSEERGTFASLVIIQTLKPIPRARSSPRSRCARKRIGMGSSASINFPSRNDEPGAFIPRRLRATIGFPFSISLLVRLFIVFFFFVFTAPTTRTRLSQATAGSLVQQLKRTNLYYRVCA